MATTSSAPANKGISAPEILWAQRSSEDEPEKNVVMVTINVPNLPPQPATKIDLSETGFKFHTKVPADKAHGMEEREYAFDLTLFDQIDVENSKISQNAKALYLNLRKKEAKLEYWPRLSKDKIRLHNVKTDFDKWVDEDEQTGNVDDFGAMGDGGMGGMDPSMAGMGGMPGMGGMGGGAGGMDLQAMLAQMQAGGGAGMPGMPDLGGMGTDGFGEDDDDEGDDDEANPIDAVSGQGKTEPVEEIQSEGVAAKDIEKVD